MGFEFDVIGLLALAIGGIIVFVRTEMQSRTNKENLAAHIAAVDVKFAEMRSEHDKDLLKIETVNAANNTAIWNKLETMNMTMMRILESFGEIKGRIGRDETR